MLLLSLRSSRPSLLATLDLLLTFAPTSSSPQVLFLSLYSPSLPPTTPHPTPLYTSTSSSGSTILMSSLSSHSQVPVVPPGSQTDATVKWIANFHAAFMEGMKEGAMKVERLGENGGWEQGTHLEMGKRPSTGGTGAKRQKR